MNYKFFILLCLPWAICSSNNNQTKESPPSKAAAILFEAIKTIEQQYTAEQNKWSEVSLESEDEEELLKKQPKQKKKWLLCSKD